jgi:Tol biopolymer transport system component
VFKGPGGIWWTRADGGGKPGRLTASDNDQWPRSFTPDGKRFAYHEIDLRNGSANLWTVPLNADGTAVRAGHPEPYLQGPFNKLEPEFSPDGRWIAYTSDETGEYQIYVRAFPDRGAKWQVSSGGGLQPVWSHTANQLFFRTAYQIMVASFSTKSGVFLPDKPRLWTEIRLAKSGPSRNFDLAPDGKRVVALTPIELSNAPHQQNHVVFLQNLLDELQRRMPLR